MSDQENIKKAQALRLKKELFKQRVNAVMGMQAAQDSPTMLVKKRSVK